jgi:MFS transporter, DHA2 family, multidrug resistance protein
VTLRAADPASVGPATRREWTGLAVLALPTAMVSFDIGALFLALPRLGAALQAGSTQLLWITDVYGFFIAGCLITMGSLGDRIGRRRLLMAGTSAFAVLSVLAAFAPSAEMLIGARGLLGVAGATLMPSTLALISTMFRDPRQRRRAIALWTSCLMAGATLGPVLGGVLLEHFWWGSVFVPAVPVALLLLVTAPVVLPEDRGTGRGPLDVASVGLSLAAVLPMVHAVKQLAVHGWPAVATALPAAVVGVGSAVMFTRRQRRLVTPLLDLRPFADRSFRVVVAIGLVAPATTGGLFLIFSQYVQIAQPLSPLRAGLWLTPAALAMAAGSLLAPSLLQRGQVHSVLAAGLATAAAGSLLLSRADGPLMAAVAVAVIHGGLGPVFTVTTDLIVASAPPERAGSAAAVSETTSELGLALGVAVLGSLATAVHRHAFTDTIPSTAPAEALAVAREGLAGAVAVGAPHPGTAASVELLAAIRDAATSGLSATAASAAVVLAGLAITAATRLRPFHDTQILSRRIQPPSTPGKEGSPWPPCSS